MYSSDRDFLSEKYTIDTPENVTFGYEVAGIGSRFIGALIDTILLALSLLLLNIVLLGLLAAAGTLSGDLFSQMGGNALDWTSGVVLAIYALLNFLLFWGYYIIFELLWNGQTPGKRLANTRVVRMDGNPITFWENVIRNLVRIIDFMPSAYGVGLITMFCNRHARRLGDFAAGTIVIKELPKSDFDGASPHRPRADALFTQNVPAAANQVTEQPAPFSPSLSAPSRENDPLWTRFAHVQQLTSGEYELVSDLLSRMQQHTVEPATVHRLATVLAQKLQMERPTAAEAKAFLADLAEAYRRFGR